MPSSTTLHDGVMPAQEHQISQLLMCPMEIQLVESLSHAAVETSRSAPQRVQESPRLVATWARHEDEVREAQRLRYEVFADEMGASLPTHDGLPGRLDVDRFDAFCEHLVVRTVETEHTESTVVGTYRVLTPSGARQAGSLYSDGEFDLSALDHVRHDLAELGRSCIASQWRTGGVILLLWSQLVTFMNRNQLHKMIGCASVGMRDGGHVAASLWQQLSQSHLSEPQWRVTPRLALPVDELQSDLKVEPPPLIKGYLNCGAKVLGAPAWDPDFGTADLPMMLDLKDLPAAYRRRFKC